MILPQPQGDIEVVEEIFGYKDRRFSCRCRCGQQQVMSELDLKAPIELLICKHGLEGYKIPVGAVRKAQDLFESFLGRRKKKFQQIRASHHLSNDKKN